MAIVDSAFREWIAEFKAMNPGFAETRQIIDTAQYAFAAGRKAQRETDAAQPSPGGQGDALVTDEMVQAACKVWAETPGQGEDWMRTALKAALAARQPVGEPLWCMHILGPDDVHAAPSKAHAEKAAAALNAFHAAREEQSEHDPKVEAVVAPWPHSAESHAESVADFIPGWLLPRWQVEASQTDAAPPAQAVDLGQFRELANEMDRFRTKWKTVSIAEFNHYADRLLALIDSQAVGNG